MEGYAEIKAQLTRIETAIMGDDKMGTKGIVHQQVEHGKKIIELQEYKNKDEKFKQKIAGGAAVGIPLLTLGWNYLMDWLKGK